MELGTVAFVTVACEYPCPYRVRAATVPQLQLVPYRIVLRMGKVTVRLQYGTVTVRYRYTHARTQP